MERCKGQFSGCSVAERTSSRGFRKLEDWDSEDEFGPTLTAVDKLSNQANKNGRVVVLKHMFTLVELEEDPSLLLDLKEDVREECAILGDVTNVVLYDVRVVLLFHPGVSLTAPCSFL